MAKVLILSNAISAVYNQRKEFIDKLLREGHSVAISTPEGVESSYFVDKGCHFIETPISRRGTNVITDMKLMKKYWQIIKVEKPDVILTYTIKANIYGGIVAKSLKVPYMTNITGLGSAVLNGGMLQRITLYLYRTALSRVSCVFFQNQENLEFFLDKGILKRPYRLIPGSGVNLEKYRVLDYEDGDKLNFLFISRVMKEKGIEEYFHAAEVIRTKYPETAFHILGLYEDDYKDRLEDLEGRGIIQYHGYQESMNDFYAMSHCIVHPTYAEGMSNVLLESSACGRPVITTNISGCREVVDEGVNGFFVEKQDAEDLVRVIERFRALPHEQRKTMGLAGRKKVEETFDRNIVMQVYMEEINQILRRTSQVDETDRVSVKVHHDSYRRTLLHSRGRTSTGRRR